MKPVDLSVVVPTHNAQATVGELIESLLGITEITTQLIFVDDASTDETVQLLEAHAAGQQRVLVLANERNLGAGVARNIGFARASGRYTLFFDDDDVIHPAAVVAAVRALDQGGQDVAIMKYRYQRGAGDSNEEMTKVDLALWSRLVGDASSRTVTLDSAPGLLNLTNYPWNKVIRTSVYQAAGLKFGSTMVNNDILGHWYSLLFANQILLLNEVVCTHIVLTGGNNLTNRASGDRLSLITALDETYDMLEEHPDLRRRYAHQYWDSVLRVTDWARGRLSPEFQAKFADLLENHLLRINVSDFIWLSTKRDPELSLKIIKRTFR